MRRVPQPPINPALRDPEQREFWPGLVLAIAGALLLFYGVRNLTSIPTVDGANAREMQLVKAFASGGLQYAAKQAPPPPPQRTGDPVRDAEALDRWARQNSGVEPLSWKVRVDVAAKTPCPT